MSIEINQLANNQYFPPAFPTLLGFPNIIWIPYYQDPTTGEVLPVYPHDNLKFKLSQEQSKCNRGARSLH